MSETEEMILGDSDIDMRPDMIGPGDMRPDMLAPGDMTSDMLQLATRRVSTEGGILTADQVSSDPQEQV